MEMRYQISKGYHSTLKKILEDLNDESICGPMFLVDDVELNFLKQRRFDFKIKNGLATQLVKTLKEISKNDKYFYLKRNYIFTGQNGKVETGPYRFSDCGTVSFYKEYAQESAEKIKKLGKKLSLFQVQSRDKIKTKKFTGWGTSLTNIIELGNDEGMTIKINFGSDHFSLFYITPKDVKKTIEVRTKSMADSSIKLLIEKLEEQKFRELEKIVSREGENKFKIVTFKPKLAIYVVEKIEFAGMPFVRSKKIN